MGYIQYTGFHTGWWSHIEQGAGVFTLQPPGIIVTHHLHKLMSVYVSILGTVEPFNTTLCHSKGTIRSSRGPI